MNQPEMNQTSIQIAYPILAEERRVDLCSRDIALLVLMRREIELNPDGMLLTIPHSSIQSLSSRIDLIDLKDEQKAERRLTESLTRLLKADCITKADFLRIQFSADPEYQLTSLGESFAEWHMVQSRFSGEPLTAIFKAFISQLSRIVEAAETAKSLDDWQIDILPQMQHALQDMLISIQRHQRELDRRHEELRDFIPKLLTENSEDAIRQCKEKLSSVLQTINDLQESVLGSASTASALVGRLHELGDPLNLKRFDVIYDDLVKRLGSIAAWISQRVVGWTEHHGIVHSILRTIVRVDRQRRITDALKRSVAEVPQWSLVVTDDPPFLKMRSDVVRKPKVRTPVRMSRAAHEEKRMFDEIQPDKLPDLLRRYVYEEMASFAEARTSRILIKALPEAKPNQIRILSLVPELTALMANVGVVDNKERQWINVSDEIKVEEFRVGGK